MNIQQQKLCWWLDKRMEALDESSADWYASLIGFILEYNKEFGTKFDPDIVSNLYLTYQMEMESARCW